MSAIAVEPSAQSLYEALGSVTAPTPELAAWARRLHHSAVPATAETPRRRVAVGVGLALLALAPVAVGGIAWPALGAVDILLSAYTALLLAVTSAVMFIAFALYRDPSVSPARPTLRPRVTCLVAVRNELAMIDRCLSSILASSYRELELVVVDDGSTDGTSDRLRELAARDGFTLISLPRSVGKKRALATGLRVASGELLVFTDSDCILAEDAIDRVVRAFAGDPELGAVAGHVRALNAKQSLLTRIQDSWYEGQFSVWKAAESVFGAVSCISGPLAAFRREAVYAFVPAWAEDTFLGREFRFATDRQLTGYVLGTEVVGERVVRRHAASPFVREGTHRLRRWRVAYVKSARAWTLVPPTLGRFARQQVRWKKSFIRNLCFTGSFYWRKGPAPAFLFYGHAVFVLAAPFMAVRHLIYLPLSGQAAVAGLYVGSLLFKGSVWGLAYRAEQPGCRRYVFRPLMSLLNAVLFSPLLLYSALTLRRDVWARG